MRPGTSRRLVVLAALWVALVPGSVRAADPPFVDGRVLVRWKPGAAASARAAARTSVAAVPRARYAFIDAELLEVPAGAVASTVARLRGDARVQWAEPDYVWRASVTPSDSLFARQWSLHNSGQTGGRPGADIRATTAWDVFTGDSTLRIGVIDTGLDYTHPDIAANVWTNPGEIPGNGLDDDGDGYIDDVHGYDVYNNDGDPFDDNGHGSHVAGIIAARGDDGRGVTGVCWRAQLVPIKFLGAGGTGTTSGAVAALQYALRVGVRITNNSWGGGAFSQALQDAVDAVGLAGQLLVAAAGNSASDNDVVPNYPSGFDRPWVIAVAATDDRDQLAPYSNFGATTVDLAAPGSNILSLAPGGGWRVLSGTSMACPHVTGAAALLWGRLPQLDAIQVKSRLLAAADTLGALEGACRTGGRLNALLAIADPDSVGPAAIRDVAIVDLGSDFATLSWTASGDDSLAGRASSYDIRVSSSPITEANFAAARAVAGPDPLPSGSPERFEVGGLGPDSTYWFALRARDERGNPGPVSNLVTGTTAGPPALALAPDSLAAVLEVGGVTTGALSIGNVAQGTLDWNVPLPELLFAAQVPPDPVPAAKGEDGPAGPPQVFGRGGPDAFGYRWVDSDQSDGPRFAWVDATTAGEVLQMGGDDVISPPLDIGFEFPFYDRRVTQLRVCTNGFLSFADTSPFYSNQPLPTSAGPPDLVAPFWDDLDFGTEYRVWTLKEPGRFTVAWVGPTHYAGGGPYTFEAILEANGEIRFQYLALGEPRASATAGIQNADHSSGLGVVFNAPYLHDSLTVRIVPVPQWLTLEPSAGRVRAGLADTPAVRFAASGLLAGVYRGSVRVLTNDRARPQAEVPVRLEVHGAPDLVARPRTLDFGSPFAGATVERAVTLANVGTDTLHLGAIRSIDPRIQVDSAPAALAAGQSFPLLVRFVAPTADTLDALLEVASDDPDTPVYPIPLAGRAVPAPSVRVAPESVAVALASNATLDTTVRLTNLGAGPYTFSVDAVPDDVPGAPPARVARPPAAAVLAPITSFASGGPDAFGNTWRDGAATGGPAFTWEDVRAFGTRIALGGDDALSDPIPIGFDFPFYGIPQRRLRVCTNGWVSFTDSTRVTPANTPLPSNSAGAPENLLAVFWDDLVFGPQRRVWVRSDPQHCVIQYQEVPRFGSGESTRPNTFEIVLFPDGSLEYRYLALRAAVLSSATVGIQDAARDDGLQVVMNAAYLRDSMVVRFHPPLRWLTITPDQGLLPAGQSTDLTLHVDAAALFGGVYRGAVRIAGDDPQRPVIHVPAALTVSGAPELRVSPAALDFGVTYAGWPRTLPLAVRNPGTDTLHVTTPAIADARVSVEPAKFAVPPLAERTVQVRFAPAGPGTLAGVLGLAGDDPANPRVDIPLAGVALDPPLADVAPGTLASVAARGTVAAARERERVVLVRNPGASPLHWSATARLGPAIASGAPLEREDAKGDPGAAGALGTGGPDPFGYAWTDSDEPGGPPFAWEAATPGTTRLPFVEDDETLTGIPLPFLFPFYGRTFDHVNVCSNGWLSFTSTRTTFTNTGLPNAGAAVPENLIAVFWDDQSFDPPIGGGGADWDGNPQRFVVTFRDVPRVGGGGPSTYQVVLRPSGDIDLQYLRLGSVRTSATVGLQDSSRTVGLQVVANAGYLHDGLRVRLARVEPWLALARDSGTVAPGGVDSVRVTLRAADRDSARYRGEVRIVSDDPAHPVRAVACALDVALERAAFALPPPPLAAALLGDSLRVGAPGGTLVRPLAAWIGDVSVPPRAGPAGTWSFAFDLFAARAAAQAAGGALTVAVEDSARAWVIARDSVALPQPRLDAGPLRALGTGGDTVRVRTGAPLALDWDDPPGVAASGWDVWLSLDGGHTWRPWALGLAERHTALAWPDAPAASVRVEVTGRSGAALAWSWLSDPAVLEAAGEGLPKVFALRFAGPNPTPANASFRLELPRAAEVTLEVLDVRGARVRRDPARSFAAGRHALLWDGRDDGGRRVPPGLYLVRVAGAGTQAVRRVVILR